MSQQGSGGNVLAALCNVFVPGLGQLVQGRIMSAILFFIVIVTLYALWVTAPVAVILQIWAIIDAAKFKGNR